MDSMDSMMRVCSKDGCEMKHHGKGLCGLHYERQRAIDGDRSTPEYKAKAKERGKKYRERPEVKKRVKKYNKQYRQKHLNDHLISERKRYHENKNGLKEKKKLAGYEWKKKNLQKWHLMVIKSQKKRINEIAKDLSIPLKQYMKIQYLYKTWSVEIKIINGNYCNICGSTKQVESHHIFHSIKYPLLSLNENNGIPLCRFCHYQAHGKLLIQPLQNFPS